MKILSFTEWDTMNENNKNIVTVELPKTFVTALRRCDDWMGKHGDSIGTIWGDELWGGNSYDNYLDIEFISSTTLTITSNHEMNTAFIDKLFNSAIKFEQELTDQEMKDEMMGPRFFKKFYGIIISPKII